METIGSIIKALLALAVFIGFIVLTIKLLQVAVMRVFLVDFTFSQAIWLWCGASILLNFTTSPSSD